jgi:RecB family exonuclease
MQKDLRLSVSKTKTFIDCPKKFKFSYVEKLPRKEWDYHVLGKFCHKVLEDFHIAYLASCTDPYNITMNKCFKAAQAEYTTMTAEMTKEAFGMLHEYLKIVSQDKKNNLVANVMSVEKNFEVKVGDHLVLNGMIDRIQLDPDGVIHVCDYKTSKNKKYLANDFFQLLTYAYVIISENPDLDKVRASYIMLRHNFEYITKDFSIAEIMAVESKYLKYAETINTEEIYQANPTALCSYCDYLDLCPEGKSKSFGKPFYGEVAW